MNKHTLGTKRPTQSNQSHPMAAGIANTMPKTIAAIKATAPSTHKHAQSRTITQSLNHSITQSIDYLNCLML